MMSSGGRGMSLVLRCLFAMPDDVCSPRPRMVRETTGWDVIGWGCKLVGP